MKRLLACLLLALMAAFLAFSPVFGQEEDEEEGPKPFIKPPANAREPKDEHEGITSSVWTFQPEDESDAKAKGNARVMCYSDDKDLFRLDVSGLKPKSVYTVWFVSSQRKGAERAGVGAAPYSFKTGGGGSKIYQSPLQSCPLVKFKWVEIRIHPDGDPKNVESSVRVLKARMIAE